MSSIHAPDDDLDERFQAAHAHPGLAAVTDFEALDLSVKAHANDPKRADPLPKARARRVSQAQSEGEGEGEEDEVDSGGVYDHEGESPDEEMGHNMMLEEFEQSLNKPTEIEIDGSPFV
jgi:hypothetical protein